MFKLLMLVVLLSLAVGGFAWYSAQSLPDWYQHKDLERHKVVNQLANQIKQKGAANFLGDKFAQVMQGELILSEVEFNALIQSSLASSRDGRLLLQVSDAINAEVKDSGIELGMIIDLEKVSRIDPKAKKFVGQLRSAMPFLTNSQVFVAVQGRPRAHDGKLAISDDFTIKLGGMPIASGVLKQLGVPTEKVSNERLALALMSVSSVTTKQDQIILGVTPRF